MPSRGTGALVLAILLVGTALGPARQDLNPTTTAVVELLLPTGATATVDGKEVPDPRAVAVEGLKADEIRRVKVSVKFADGSEDERLIDVVSGQRLRVAIPQPGPEKAAVIGMQPLVPINSAAVSRDRRYIAVGLEDRAVVLWDTETGVPLRTYKGHTGAVASAAFSPDGERFLTGSHDGTAILWQTRTGERVLTLKSREILGVAYSPDGATLATSSADRTAALWDARTGKQNFVLRGHREDVTSVAFSPDSRRVITGSAEDLSIIWDAVTGKRITPTGRHTNNVNSVAFTPNGRRVISGEREELVMMWDASTGAQVRTFVGHNAEILSIVPSPDGRTMLTGSRDGTARLWDLATGRLLLALTTDATRRTWAVVSPDGLFDASEAGRRVLGYRFLKLPGGEVDQFFVNGYRPGLLAEVWRGEWPFPAQPLGKSKAPLVKLVPPKSRTSTTPIATLSADLTDQGGGVGDLVVENNGVRVAVQAKAEPAPGGQATRVTFAVPLAPGSNKIRVKAANRDASRESTASELDLTHPRIPGQRGRMYVVAVGVGSYAEKGLRLEYPTKDAQAVADLLRRRGAEFFDRIDVVPLLDREATKAAIEDTIRDVAELTRPQDALVVLLCGHGALIRDKLHFAPHDLRLGSDRPEDALRTRGLALDDLAAALGTAPAHRRVLVLDTAASGETFRGALKDRSEFGLRGAVERLSRSQGIYILAATPATDRAAELPELGRGLLAHSLLAAADGAKAVPPTIDVIDWFHSAVERAGPVMDKFPAARADVQASTRARGFSILQPEK